jgi:hypothetical protein
MLSAGPPTTYCLEVKMGRRSKRGPGPSHLLITPDRAGNVVGVDPHKRTLTATVVDARAGVLGSEHFRVSGDGIAIASSIAASHYTALVGGGETVRASSRADFTPLSGSRA